ncbi:ankyrin repeat domain-containing protein [Paenibacillus sp. V4I5]|uniref:ankyrin repeat domain-containing protein n=1 Tax=Paenibacillus sp. V4I5 TaxID=3042306 RepID=UPI00279363F6|nr:ankyrin repeat domain-containing protein [Paenibacillus sp. V4I5]MDQ0914553.1 hypothetical protein [Paenibacillus sp. V4I5]
MDPLFEAIKNNDISTFKFLLVSRRGDLTAVDESGKTPLISAVIMGNMQFAQLLLAFGSDINKCDFDGCSVLHFACQNNDTELVEMLITSGAKFEIADKNGNTPLEYALSRFGEDSHIAQILMKNSSERIEKQASYIWCLVGNIVENRYFGEKREVRRGTKKFTPNTKVYCFPPLWGDGYEEIKVIGRLKNRKNLGVIITSSKYIRNWRLQKVFQPFVVKTMHERGGWDATEESKRRIENMLVWLPNRTVVVGTDPNKPLN